MIRRTGKFTETEKDTLIKGLQCLEKSEPANYEWLVEKVKNNSVRKHRWVI